MLKQKIFFCLILLCSFLNLSYSADTVIEINQAVTDNVAYRKAEFSSESSSINHYFKYTVTNVPSSKITAFRVEFDQFSELEKQRDNVYCTFVDESATDEDLIQELRILDASTSSCVGAFNEGGIYDGIIKFDDKKKKLGIYVITLGGVSYTARVFLRISEKILDPKEQKAMEDESYSLVPYTVVISDFRSYASKILFYSYTRELQMYYAVNDAAYPEKLFSGNIMNVFTNPNMVHQKYHDANYMTLLTNPFGAYEMVGEAFKFQVKFFASEFLLEYIVSANQDGRSLNTPLSVNMTQCTTPYYLILNYNKPQGQITLHIDEVYGKIEAISLAQTLTQATWEDMLEKDLVAVNVTTRKEVLKKNIASHIDVYKITCAIPILLNFYYVDETQSIPELDFGKVSILSLKNLKTVTVPFKQGINSPEINIQVFNPNVDPFVIVNDGQNDYLIRKNSLVKAMPWNMDKGIVIKEKGNSKDTRVIIKVGYSTSSWEAVSDYVSYSKELNMYVFTFPNGPDKLNYTHVNLVTRGVTEGDNIKYCYSTNLGSAVSPSSENCYRVSLNNPYTLKLMNPSIMYKDYEIDDEILYYVSLKPVVDSDKLNIEPFLISYNTPLRNYESINTVVTIDSFGQYSTILTAPKEKTPTVFVQIQTCQSKAISYDIVNAYDNTIVIEKTSVPSGTNNYFKLFNNVFMETELEIYGDSGTNIFVKHVGLRNIYSPSVKSSFNLEFIASINQLNIETPLRNFESMKYTILYSAQGEISRKVITLCSFAAGETISRYNKTVTSSNEVTSVYLNFEKAGLKAGDKFEVIVFAEQQDNSQMDFLSEVLTGTVGDITSKSIFEISNNYPSDSDYLYATHLAEPNEMTYYFWYLPATTLDVPVGAFSIELDPATIGGFTHVDCAFVDDTATAFEMFEAVEDAIEQSASYCIGGQSKTSSRKYNYIFKYAYDNGKPKKMVIKISNGRYADGNFNIYMKKLEGVQIIQTDFVTQKEYGQDEETKKSVIPYIVDLKSIRGSESSPDKISKIMFYSSHLEMQMYYIDENLNTPQLLFTGNIMLVLTKPSLAEQKYHATTLVLLSENILGQDHTTLGGSFRFHTKMFRSEDQIEYYVSANPEGRTLNYPLSLEMNTCTAENNKYYYILNYNKAESQRILHLDMVFGKYKRARLINQVNAERWYSLISDSMTEINNYQIELNTQSQHMDIVEIECLTPLLANAYYNYKDQEYSDLKRGDIIIKSLGPGESTSFTIDSTVTGGFYYSISTWNPTEEPDVVIRFNVGTSHRITENALQIGVLFSSPENIFMVNNVESETRVIFKIGLGVESEWVDEKQPGIEGKLYSKDNQFVYKFPLTDNRKNFTNVNILVKPISDEPNVKFCYSTNMGMAIDTSKENCFRTGKNIPYELTFMNPLVAFKNYKTYSENYYVSFKPWDEDAFLTLQITENKYDTFSRTNEGIHNVVTLDSQVETHTILSVLQNEYKNIFIQMAACDVGKEKIGYKFLNVYSGEEYQSGSITYTDKDQYYQLENKFMEIDTNFIGEVNDTVFIKFTGIDDYHFNIEQYKSTFDIEQNVVSIIKPINDEEFSFTVLVGKPGTLSSYTLCTFSSIQENEYTKLADYVRTFTSVSSNKIIHYIDFKSFGYSENDKFDLLIYAVQKNNIKMEFLYDVISGQVGTVKGVVKVAGSIDGKPDYVTQDFVYSYASNYLYYDFARKPTGNIAAIKLKTNSGLKITKVGCVFTQTTITDEDMMSAVNQAVRDGTSYCYGEPSDEGFDALVSANYISGRGRLVIQVITGFADEKTINDDSDIMFTLNMRINGYSVADAESQYNEEEKLTVVPYVIDLLAMREHTLDQGDYVSKVMLYSNTREMQMFYVDSTAPTELFRGNIMLVYTNEELIKQKYHGATTMILITDALHSTSRQYIGEKFRFKVNFFNSASQIQYYISPNEEGRMLNNPVGIEMLSCDQPYYYIMNYNLVEGTRKLHVDNVFGEINTIKIATQLNTNNWYDLVESMVPFQGNEIVLEGQDKYHIDVVEVTCKIPLLLNLYYTDPEVPKVSNLEQGDISIFSLTPGQSQTIRFKLGIQNEFLYSFNVFKETSQNSNILVSFEDGSSLDIKQNGVYVKKSKENFSSITVRNRETSGSASTRIIFKFGYVIESSFNKIENGLYHNDNIEDRTQNLYGYKFDTSESRLNYTKVAFKVETKEENVKFCYSANLGAYINPSLSNCYRVGRANPYTIEVLNPFVMFKNYYSGNILDFYVGFVTTELSQDIIITPTLYPYNTKTRSSEGAVNTLALSSDGTYDTILTAPSSNVNNLFVHIEVCTKDESLLYDYLNAYNSSTLDFSGEIQANTKNNFKTITNTKLDTVLKMRGTKGTKVYVKHVGVPERYQPVIQDIKFYYDNKDNIITFTQPIENEEFKYTLYLDKRNNILNQGYSLCSFYENSKIAHYSTSVTSKEKEIKIELDFSESELKGYEDFDAIILAEQVNNGKLAILSQIFNKEAGENPNNDDGGSNMGLIIVIIILSIILVVGGAILVIMVRKKQQSGGSMQSQIEAKTTSLSDINGTPQDKLLVSQASTA